MADGTDDQLARTATAPGRATSIADEKLPSAGESLGRYRLERELGAGGMGVVFAAFDSKLERRIALKVLRRGGAGSDANRRLLNEARAMARLTHSNVVTVHEADSIGGRDYVAMELIDGETLAEWMRIAPRTPEAIVAAFVAAGRGLAAAHSAGLVHRDFKPHNVLRRTDGRIAVTDFGLARDAGADPMAVTVDLGRPTGEGENTPSVLSGLTATGSLLGTPAYMAPEQWSGGKIGPAADQFAFCVALWEALAGERPYRGDSFEALKEAIGKGPAGLDGAKLPKALRAPLARGLDPDPTKRWPTMTALLDALDRTIAPPKARRLALRWRLALIAVALLISFGVDHFWNREPAVADCRAPAHDPATIWPQPLDGHAMLGKVLAGDLAAWQSVRADACKAEPEKRDPALTCLDGVIARFDTIRRAAAQSGGATDAHVDDSAITWLVDPHVCTAITPPPRLTLEPTPAIVGALVERFKLLLGGHASTGTEPTEPCANAIALFTRTIDDHEHEREDLMQRATIAADRCGDDRLRADLAIADAWKPYRQPKGGSEGENAIVRADGVAQHVLQSDLTAEIESLRAVAALQNGLDDAALALRADAAQRFQSRGRTLSAVDEVTASGGLRLGRHSAADLVTLTNDAAVWRPVAEAAGLKAEVADLDSIAAYVPFFQGDVATAQQRVEAAWRAYVPYRKPSHRATHVIAGVVVDEAGHPVAGATVVADRVVTAVSTSIVFPQELNAYRVATTDDHGGFAIPDGIEDATVVAEHDHERSAPAVGGPSLKLVLAPTRRISGKLEIGPNGPAGPIVGLSPTGEVGPIYQVIAPAAADGSFSIDGAPTGALHIGAVTGGNSMQSVQLASVPAGHDPVTDIKIAVSTNTRALVVIVRSTMSTPIGQAEVIVLTGSHLEAKTSGDLQGTMKTGGTMFEFATSVSGEKAPQAAIGLLETGDLVAQFKAAPDGELTVCAIPLPSDLSDPHVSHLVTQHNRDLELKCKSLAPDAKEIVIETPPQKRLE